MKCFKLLVLFLLAFYSEVISVTDLIIKSNTKDTISGTIVPSSLFKSPNKIFFTDSVFKDTIEYSVTEVIAFSVGNKSYEVVEIPDNITRCSKVFAEILVKDCMTLHRTINQEGDTIFLVKKGSNKAVVLDRYNYKDRCKAFFREQSEIHKNFRTKHYNFDSLIVAVNAYNEWLIESHYDCNFTETIGFVKAWENLGLAWDVSGKFNYLQSGDYKPSINWGLGFGLGVKIDLLSHFLSINPNYSYSKLSGRNSIRTKDYLSLHSFGVNLHVNKLLYRNPFNKISLFVGYNYNFSNYQVQAINCDFDNYKISNAVGNSFEFGISRQKQWQVWSIGLQKTIANNTIHQDQYNMSVLDGFNPYLTGEKESFLLIYFSYGIRFSLVPLIRQLKSI